MEIKDITIGQPLVFKSSIYGDTAVHVTAVYHDVVHFTIDGGEASRQVRDFPELSDGTYFAISSRLEKRPSKTKNTIREVSGVGKVAIITDDRPKTTAQRNKRRLSLVQALTAAREMVNSTPASFNWAESMESETF